MKDYKQIDIQKLASSSIKERYLLMYNGLYFEAGEAVVELLYLVYKKKIQKKKL